jgi:hypothetical protein
MGHLHLWIISIMYKVGSRVSLHCATSSLNSSSEMVQFLHHSYGIHVQRMVVSKRADQDLFWDWPSWKRKGMRRTTEGP